MNEPTCDNIVELLVDYSDGELSAADRQRVESHLSDCPACLSEVERLGRSLELAQSVWTQAAEETARCATEVRRRSPPRRQSRFRLAALAAACAALLLVGLGRWLLVGGSREVASRQRSAPVERGSSDPAARKAVASSEDAGVSEDTGVEEILARETRAARLAAAARLLATEPSLKAYQVEAERYLTETYPEASTIHPSDRRGTIPRGKESKS
jgi:anti-sigma factor RsiW